MEIKKIKKVDIFSERKKSIGHHIMNEMMDEFEHRRHFGKEHRRIFD